MTTQEVYINKYDWYVVFLYNVSSDDLYDIVYYSKSVGISEKNIAKTVRLIERYKNIGVTAADYYKRNAVVIVGSADSSKQFFNTLIHELKHLVDFIAKSEDIELTGEELAYMMGDIGMELFPFVSKYICSYYD